MFRQCENENGSHSACRDMARIYYRAARSFGKKRAAEVFLAPNVGAMVVEGEFEGLSGDITEDEE